MIVAAIVVVVIIAIAVAVVVAVWMLLLQLFIFQTVFHAGNRREKVNHVKWGDENAQSSTLKSFFFIHITIKTTRKKTNQHYYVPFATGENSKLSCSHCEWHLQFNDDI